MRYPALLIAALLLTACGEPEDTRPGQPVAHRRAAFGKILHAFEPMGIQLRKNQYDAERFLALARELNALKEGPWTYFAADTNYPPSHATARVWSEPAQFDSDRQAFLRASEALLVAAESRDEKQVSTAYAAVHDSCRSCHKAFKD